MYKIRHNDLTPRVEMLPLIDVIFLLLTFFIYSLIVMVKAQVLPVELSSVTAGQSSTKAVVNAITVDEHGKLFFNRKPMSLDQLDNVLADLAKEPKAAKLYLAMQAKGQTDRGPVLLKVIEKVRAAGITEFTIVGAPGS
jgi:biopolymer transport protein ExbD